MNGADSGFLGLPKAKTDPRSARFVVLPGGYEETTTYVKGTSGGPAAIVAASQQVELYDEELEDEAWKAGVHTAPAFPFPKKDPEGAMGAMERETARWLRKGKRVGLRARWCERMRRSRQSKRLRSSRRSRATAILKNSPGSIPVTASKSTRDTAPRGIFRRSKSTARALCID